MLAAGFWSFLASQPSSIDGTSVRLWLTQDLWPLLLAVAAWSVFLGLGRRARTMFGPPEKGFPDTAASAALGLVLAGESVFLLGWAGGLTAPGLLLVISLLTVFSIGALTRPRVVVPSLGPFEACCALLLTFVLLCAVLNALAPPVLWDARAYHLVLPELALAAGRWSPLPWLLHSHWPQIGRAHV